MNYRKTLTMIMAISLILMSYRSFAQTAEELLPKAIQLEEVKGELEEAIEVYQTILKNFPENKPVTSKALLHIGFCYEKLGLKQARKTYQDVINIYPEQTDEVALAKKRVKHLEAYAADISKKAEQHLKEGNELFSRWEYESAIEKYKNAIELVPNTQLAQNAQYCIGQSWFRSGKYDVALATFKKLVEDNPESNIAPVTELMISQVEHSLENNKQALPEITGDENKIVDPETGISYLKVKTFAGKYDIISHTGGFNLSPDARFVVLENKVVPLNGTEPFDLVDMDVLRAVYSPNMKKACFYADSAIWVVSVSPLTGKASGKPKKLLEGSYTYQHVVAWSPDAEKIAFIRRDETVTSDIWTLNISNGQLEPVTDHLGIEHSPAWSPDGKYISYDGDGVFLAPIDGGNHIKILKNGGYPIWSPDSKWLFLSNWENKRLFSLDLNAKLEYTSPKQVGKFIGFAPQGDKMLFFRSSYNDNWGLKVVSMHGGPSFKPALNSPVYDSHWSGDGRFILTQSEDNKGDVMFKLVPLTGGNSVDVKIDVNVKGKPFPFTVSPDLTQIAFSIKGEDGNEDLYLVPFSMKEAKTNGPARLIFSDWSGGAYNVTFSLSDDETKLALIHNGDIWMIPLNGGEPKQITNTPENERWVDWSPDSKWISYYTQSKTGGILHIISAENGISRVVVNNCRGSRWSPDSKSFALLSKGELKIVSLNGKTLESISTVKDLKLTDASAPQYSPDGKTLAFIGYNNDDSYIYLYSIKNKGFTRLAFDVLDDSKYSMRWSPDGKWLSYLTCEQEKVRPEGVLWEADFEEIKEKLLQ